MDDDYYVPGADFACRKGGCQLARMQETLKASAAVLAEHLGRSHMSRAMWCDQGGHAFSEKDPGRQHLSMTIVADDGSGRELQEARDICGQCAADSGLLAARKTRPADAPAIAPADTPPPAQPAFYPADNYTAGHYGTGQYAGRDS